MCECSVPNCAKKYFAVKSEALNFKNLLVGSVSSVKINSRVSICVMCSKDVITSNKTLLLTYGFQSGLGAGLSQVVGSGYFVITFVGQEHLVEDELVGLVGSVLYDSDEVAGFHRSIVLGPYNLGFWAGVYHHREFGGVARYNGDIFRPLYLWPHDDGQLGAALAFAPLVLGFDGVLPGI